MIEIKRDDKFIYGWAQAQDVIKVHEFITKEYEKLHNKDVFSIDTYNEMFDAACKSGSMLMALSGDEIAAIWYAQKPSDEKNYANDVDKFEIDKSKVIHNNASFVAEKYRGNKLQNKMRAMVTGYLEEQGFTVFMGTVSPHNIHSYKNILDSGYYLVAFKMKYKSAENPNGLERYITYKSIDKQLEFNDNEIKIKGEDVIKAQELFNNGYIGTYVTDDDMIIFKQLA
ncbi:hypothetical protein [Criibacterium bergeronii]|uniref:GNAT family N-acetyltransferase n=1 Tax=Criibacterium bergeronii TaxID=1871336 RepID=A0A371IN88_9FIRM|nr:hypothetical protein [Criibacterium bergeronii]RDY21955.1 hypothetical protein BBG48_002465 [Criibacterium bergeronii]TRW26880.1 hypothetical protein FL857_05395 [Criibacterium bergeronii]